MAIDSRPTMTGVLFDLDGTLLDTAPDLIHALNGALAAAGLPPCPEAEAKPRISGGLRAMLGHWLDRRGIDLGEAGRSRLLTDAQDLYAAHLAEGTRFFEGVETVLDSLDERGLRWGIVTNKLSRFTDPLLAALNLAGRCGCVISGDTTAERKPHPLPLLEASRRLERDPAGCVYIGDAARDVEAGLRAGMATLAAAYGYVGADDEPAGWGAHGVLARPLELLAWIDRETPP
jgi:phosphoglycolate phosphatase